MSRKKRLRLTVSDVQAAHDALEERERIRMSDPKPVKSQMPPPPKSRPRKEPPEPKPVKRVMPSK